MCIFSSKSGLFSPLLFLLAVLFASVILAMPVNIHGQDEEEEFTQQGYSTSEEEVPSDSDHVKLFIEAQDAHENGDMDKALELYSAAIKAYPEFPEAEYQRATIYQSRGMLAEAEDSFRKAVEYRRDWTLAMAGLGSVLISNGKYAEAELLLESALRLDGLSFPAYSALSDLYSISPPGEQKLRALSAKLFYLTSKSNAPASIWASMATVSRLLGDLDSARSSLAKSFILETGNKRALFEASEIAIASSDYEAAIGFAKTLETRFPKEIGPKLLLARCHALNGETAKAVSLLESIENPDTSVTDMLTSIRLSGNQDVGELERLLADSPENVQVLGELCKALRKVDPQKALDHCRNAYQLDRSNISHAIGYGAALVQLKQYGPAIKLLEELKKNAPDNHTVRANLAAAYFQSGGFENAKKEFEWITMKQPDLPAGFYFLAITHDRLREYMDAMANYQQFLRISDKQEFADEIERVMLRLSSLQKQIDSGQGKKQR